jgi:hypothetical protein
MAKRKKASWVGPLNELDSSNLLKPVVELTDPEQKKAAKKISPAPKPTVPKEVSSKKFHKEPVQKREEFKPKPLIVDTKKIVTDKESIDYGKPVQQEVRPAKKGELKRGITSVSIAPKKRRIKKQKSLIPKVGQAGKLDGQVVRVTPENAEQVYDQRRRTELPAAGPAEMTPAGRPEVEQVILPPRLRGSQSGKNLGGFAQSHKVVAKATHEALGHLETMANTDKGSIEHHTAHESFNLLHGQIGQIGNKALHKDLGLGRTIIQQYHGRPELGNALKVHRGIVLGRLEEGKIAEQARGERSGPRKEGQ